MLTSLSFTWLVLAAVLWLVAYLVIPRERFVRLIPFGVYAGFLLALAIQLLGVPLLGLWRFRHMMLPIFGIPFFMLVAYIPEVMLFANFLPRGGWWQAGYIVAFALANTAVEWGLLRAGLRVYLRWSLAYFFFLSLLAHIVVFYLYLLTAEGLERTPVDVVAGQKGGSGTGDRPAGQEPGDVVGKPR